MHIDDEIRYRALAARDARFDGLFFVGVTSTGIYCRPICTARCPGPRSLPVLLATGRWPSATDSGRACAAGPSWRRATRRSMRCGAPPGRPPCRIEAGALERRRQPGRAGRRPGSRARASSAAPSSRSSASRRSSWPRRSGCSWPSSCSPSRTCRSSRLRSPAVSRASGGSTRCSGRTTG